MADFAARGAGRSVVIRTPDPAALSPLLSAEGASVQREADGRLTVVGLESDRVGEIAFEHHILLHELTNRTGSLEKAFMELTADSVEYLAGENR